jgi:hypothetical protein
MAGLIWEWLMMAEFFMSEIVASRDVVELLSLIHINHPLV